MNKALYTLILLLFAMTGFSQMNQYQFKREIKGVHNEWHQIELPDDIFASVNRSLSDLRIYGITAKNDTVEVPYLLDIQKDETTYREVKFRLINHVKKGSNTYFTFMVPAGRIVNHIDLDFSRSNFDWRVDLEGSHDQNEWFSIRRNYRIVGIHNSYTEYHFTRLYFSPVKYKYLRVKIRNEWFSFFNDASVYELTGKQGQFKNYAVKSFSQRNNKASKATELNVILTEEVPISELQLTVDDKVDFVRPIQVEYLSDSTKTEKGYKRHYRHMFNGTLSSFEEIRYRFGNVYTKELRITVRNHDNLPLSFSGAKLRGNLHKMRFRLPKAERFFLVYGNENAYAPSYDLKFFEKNIPDQLEVVRLGEKLEIEKEEKKEETTLEHQDIYLWAAILFVGFLLVFFVIRMMKAEKKQQKV